MSEKLQKSFISIAIALLIVVAAFNPLSAQADTIVKNDVKYQASEISGIINILAVSPNVTTFIYELPGTDCVIKIDSAVTVTMKDASYSVNLIKSIEPAKIECNARKIRFVNDGAVRIEVVK
ncbi:MAG: hypothetical protein V1900_00090 [Candidatus Aenigmatarchaeota archaeon]